MPRCKHCNGTGEAPGTMKLECVGCQRSVTVVYTTAAELVERCKDVLCGACKRIEEAKPK